MLSFNPQREDPQRLRALTRGAARHAILDRMARDLEADVDAEVRVHQLLIGPRGAGKTHLLRVLVGAMVPEREVLRSSYFPLLLPEEVALRTPADLLLRLVEQLEKTLAGAPRDAPARALCRATLSGVRGLRDPKARLERCHEGLVGASKALGKVLLAVVENFDSVLYLGPSGGRTRGDELHWALRARMQEASHLVLLASAVTTFGAIGNADAAFHNFFRVSRLEELELDETLAIVRARLEEEDKRPGPDSPRAQHVRSLVHRFEQAKPKLSGMLVLSGGLPRFAQLLYDVLVEVDVAGVEEVIDGLLDELTPYFQQRLDPRLLPGAEIDLLNALASSWGPLQPSELAGKLYGVPINEVGALLSRLEGRGLVRRSGSPGGRAVPWDLTEPLYRLWTQFRSNSGERERFLSLAEVVAALYGAEDLNARKTELLAELADHGDNPVLLRRAERNLRFVERALELCIVAAPLAAAHPAVEPVESIAAGGSTSARPAEIAWRALVDAHRRDDPMRRDAALDDLRRLSNAHPKDAEVRKSLAMGLYNTLYHAKDESDFARCDALLDELRALSSAHPKDAEVRKQLAMGICNAQNYAKDESDLARRDALLDELRALSSAHSKDAEVRKPLAMGLYNTLCQAKDESDLARRDALLGELRALSNAYPKDAEVRENLADGLFNTLNHAKDESDLARRDALLDELRALSSAHPKDAEVRQRLSMGLLNTLNDAKNENDHVRRDALLAELATCLSRFQDSPASAILAIGVKLLQVHGAETARRVFRGVIGSASATVAESFRPLLLAAEVLVQGEEAALAREPEEMRRVVRIVLAAFAR